MQSLAVSHPLGAMEATDATNPTPTTAPTDTGMRIIALANQKGGVAKTTTAVNLAATLAELGQSVLLIDLDPQGSATRWLGADPGGRGLYDLFTRGGPLDDLAEPTRLA